MSIGDTIGNWVQDRVYDTESLLGLGEGSDFRNRQKRAREALADRDPAAAAAELEGLEARTDEGRGDLRATQKGIKTQSTQVADKKETETFERLYGKKAPGKGVLQDLQDRKTAAQTAAQRQLIEAQKSIQNLQNQGAAEVAGIQGRASRDATNISGAWGAKQADVAGKWGFESTARNALAQENTTDMSTGRNLMAQLDANNVQREVAEKQHKLGRMELLGSMYLQSKAGNQNFILGAGARKAGF